jgi:hypothetical protein
MDDASSAAKKTPKLAIANVQSEPDFLMLERPMHKVALEASTRGQLIVRIIAWYVFFSLSFQTTIFAMLQSHGRCLFDDNSIILRFATRRRV